MIEGGAGNDNLAGESFTATGGDFERGADRFVFAPGSDIDSIEDFDVGKDVIDLRGYTGIVFGDLVLDLTSSPGDTVIDLGLANGGAAGEDVLTVKAETGLSAGDFLFFA